jgi:ribosome biogenesis GTP-binding protein YlqF
VIDIIYIKQIIERNIFFTMNTPRVSLDVTMSVCIPTRQTCHGRNVPRDVGMHAGGKRVNRGKALLTQRKVRAPADDPVLKEIEKSINPVEAVRMVQWYPGHIAKAEQELKEQLKAVDMVLEVRDGRIPMSTRHPSIPNWVGNKPRVMILNRRDMVTNEEAAAWTSFFKERGHEVIWTNANKGDGVASVIKHALRVSTKMNEKRTRRGLKARPVRAVVVGFPNVGKSALINRLLGRRVADSAPRPGVTRQLRWMRIGGDLDLLDAPGIIPMSFKNQNAAQKLAMCNDIGEASYVASMVGAALLATFDTLPQGELILDKVEDRYGIPIEGCTEEDYIIAIGDKHFNSEPERAGQRILRDFRSLEFGRMCLELPSDAIFSTMKHC